MEEKAITAEQMRHYDSFTINTIGVPSLVLMERAALAVRDEILMPTRSTSVTLWWLLAVATMVVTA